MDRLSSRDVEELLAERGIRVDHVTVYRWVQRFTSEFIEAAWPCRRLPAVPQVVEQYANNPIEADHSRLKARTRHSRSRCAGSGRIRRLQL
jgi:transposase-like protein